MQILHLQFEEDCLNYSDGHNGSGARVVNVSSTCTASSQWITASLASGVYKTSLLAYVLDGVWCSSLISNSTENEFENKK
jgi:hypothetical protein